MMNYELSDQDAGIHEYSSAEMPVNEVPDITGCCFQFAVRSKAV